MFFSCVYYYFLNIFFYQDDNTFLISIFFSVEYEFPNKMYTIVSAFEYLPRYTCFKFYFDDSAMLILYFVYSTTFVFIFKSILFNLFISVSILVQLICLYLYRSWSTLFVYFCGYICHFYLFSCVCLFCIVEYLFNSMIIQWWFNY